MTISKRNMNTLVFNTLKALFVVVTENDNRYSSFVFSGNNQDTDNLILDYYYSLGQVTKRYKVIYVITPLSKETVYCNSNEVWTLSCYLQDYGLLLNADSIDETDNTDLLFDILMKVNEIMFNKVNSSLYYSELDDKHNPNAIYDQYLHIAKIDKTLTTARDIRKNQVWEILTTMFLHVQNHDPCTIPKP